jgi:hypothetical protein
VWDSKVWGGGGGGGRLSDEISARYITPKRTNSTYREYIL